jgi:hypothetical protein
VIDGRAGPGTPAVSPRSRNPTGPGPISGAVGNAAPLNLSRLVLPIRDARTCRDLVKLGRGLSNFHLAAQRTGRTVGATWQLVRK